MSTYQIAEVAQRTGFTPATLRYYEDIGLMAPAGRTPAGYRVYDEASLARLRFISRAKQLGCSLDEITDLATAWDGGECGPVLAQLRTAVDAKIADTQSRIAELITFTADLRQSAAALLHHRPEGPCTDRCACMTRPTTVDGPIACSLGAGEMTGRLEEWAAVLQGVTARRPLEDGVRLELAADTDVAEVARLAAAEQGCCGFFRFAVVIDQRGTALEVHAPPDAADVVTALFGAP